MYTEQERKEINWGLVVKRSIVALGVIVLILLLVWLVSTLANNDTDKAGYDKNNSTEVEKKTLETYSEKFIENFRYLQETGKNYWTVEGTLPQDGETSKLTLKELIEKELILPFSDKSGNLCDTTMSYVKLTNNNGKYTMTVKLDCNEEVATVTEQLGCNQFCDGACKPETVATVLEYKFKQAYTDNVTSCSCPSGYTKSGKTCYKSKNIAATPTTVSACPSGYAKKNAKCVASDTRINATATTNYYCPSGYTLSGSTCYKTSSGSIAATSNTTYTCPSGYTKSGTNCTKSSTSTAKLTTITKYTCGSGYTKTGTGSNTKCYKYTTNEGKKYFEIYPSGISSSCTYLGRKAKDNCTTNCNKLYYTFYCTETEKIYGTVKKSTTTACPSGYSKSGSTCTKTNTSTINATSNTTYSCPSGYTKSGSTCYYSYGSNQAAYSYVTYSCPTGYTKNGSICIASGKTVNLITSTQYSCPSGYNKVGSGSGSKCIKGNADAIAATCNTSKKTQYKYTWSKNSTLAGWTATGETRKVSAK